MAEPSTAMIDASLLRLFTPPANEPVLQGLWWVVLVFAGLVLSYYLVRGFLLFRSMATKIESLQGESPEQIASRMGAVLLGRRTC